RRAPLPAAARVRAPAHSVCGDTRQAPTRPPRGATTSPFLCSRCAVRSGMATINDARLREILTGSPTVAVLGIHHEPEKAAFYVPEYLHDEGYRVIGVNPQFLDQTLFGERV